MYLLYGLLVALVVSVAALLLLSLWGIPIVVVVLVVLVAYVAAAHRRDSGGRVEREKPIEPTGRTRKGTGGATPTNERVGS
jgi:membrane protein implicated in regulation of membrane protease activity